MFDYTFSRRKCKKTVSLDKSIYFFLIESLSFKENAKNVIYLSKCVILLYNITCKNKWYFSDASNSSDVEEEIIKQINTLKPFDMEPCNATPKVTFCIGGRK